MVELKQELTRAPCWPICGQAAPLSGAKCFVDDAGWRDAAAARSHCLGDPEFA